MLQQTSIFDFINNFKIIYLASGKAKLPFNNVFITILNLVLIFKWIC